MIMIQLNPQWPCLTPHGSGFAIAMIDYSQDHDTLYKVQITSGEHAGELYDVPQSEVRGVENISFGRPRSNNSLLKEQADLIEQLRRRVDELTPKAEPTWKVVVAGKKQKEAERQRRAMEKAVTDAAGWRRIQRRSTRVGMGAGRKDPRRGI